MTTKISPLVLRVVVSMLVVMAYSNPLAVQTKSGTTIPIAIVDHYTNFLSAEQISDRLCELDGLILTTVSGKIDLNVHTSEPVLLSTKDATIMSDDKVIQHSQEFETYLRRGPEYSVATNGIGQVVGIWGPQMVLSPVHSARFPNVYINTYRIKGKIRMEERHPFGDDTQIVVSGNDMDFPTYGIETSQGGGSSRIVVPEHSTRQSFCSNSGTCRTLRLAAVGDSHLCIQFGSLSATVAHLNARIALASAPYESQTCLNLKATYFEIPCSAGADPYKDFTNNPDGILESFTSYWRANRFTVDRDLAHFFPGPYVNDGLSGVAYIGATCSRTFGFGWSEDQEPIVLAHEIGHNLNAQHTTAGLMKAFWSRGDLLTFSTDSVSTITNYVDRIGSTTCLPECDGGTATSPPPTTTAPPPPKSSSCTAGFSKDNVFTCTSMSYGKIYVEGYEYLDVKIVKKQLKDKNVFIWRTTNKLTKITEISYKVTMTASRPIDLEVRKVLGTPTGKFVAGVPNNKIFRPTGVPTCCGSLIYLHMDIRFCYFGTNGVCAEGTVFLSKPMACSVCNLPVFLPQTRKQKCEICTN